MNKDVIDTYKFGIVTIIIIVSIPNIVAKVKIVTPKRIIKFKG